MKYFKSIICAVICLAMVMGASVCFAETNEIKGTLNNEQAIDENNNEMNQEIGIDDSEDKNANTDSTKEDNKQSDEGEKQPEGDNVEISPDNPTELTLLTELIWFLTITISNRMSPKTAERLFLLEN